MTRAIGDTVGQSVGITYEPEVSCRKLNEKTDRFVCLSSDGVWEFLKPREVAQTIMDNGTTEDRLNSSCNLITKMSYDEWIKNEEVTVDDITCIIFKVFDK
jgi:serine/threonine protein phosphatase PrpC